jgi:hypothetical protein
VPCLVGDSTSTPHEGFQRKSLFGKVVASRVEVRRGREWASIATPAYVASRRSGEGRQLSDPAPDEPALTRDTPERRSRATSEFRSPAIWRRYSCVVASRWAIRITKGLVLLPQRLEEVVPLSRHMRP